MSTRILELGKAGASFGSGTGGRWTCSIPSTTIEPGSSIQVLKSYVHIPGSSVSQQQALKLTEDLSATITFGYMSYRLDSFGITDMGSWLVSTGDASKDMPAGAPIYMTDDSLVLITDELTLSLSAGIYMPQQIAENLTGQLRAQGGPGTFGIGLGAGQFNFKRTNTNFATYRGAIMRSGEDELGFRASNLTQYYITNNNGNQIYYFGSDSATIAYNENTQRFSIARVHSSLKDSTGSPVVVRFSTADGSTRWYSAQQSLLIRDWGVSEADWDGGLWSALGFTFDDLNSRINGGTLNNPLSNSGLGLSTADLPAPVMAGAGDSGSNNVPSWYPISNDTKTLTISGDEAGQTNGPIASNAAALRAGAGGYWRVGADLGGNEWITSGGARLPTAYALADRSFASGDVYVGQEGPVFQLETVEPITVSEITVSITTPLTDREEIHAGPACSVLLAIYPPQPQPPQAERR